MVYTQITKDPLQKGDFKQHTALIKVFICRKFILTKNFCKIR